MIAAFLGADILAAAFFGAALLMAACLATTCCGFAASTDTRSACVATSSVTAALASVSLASVSLASVSLAFACSTTTSSAGCFTVSAGFAALLAAATADFLSEILTSVPGVLLAASSSSIISSSLLRSATILSLPTKIASATILVYNLMARIESSLPGTI